VVIIAAIALVLVEAFRAARGKQCGARHVPDTPNFTANFSFDKKDIAGRRTSITARGLLRKSAALGVHGAMVLAFLPCSNHYGTRRLASDLWLYSPEQNQSERRLTSSALELAAWGRCRRRMEIGVVDRGGPLSVCSPISFTTFRRP